VWRAQIATSAAFFLIKFILFLFVIIFWKRKQNLIYLFDGLQMNCFLYYLYYFHYVAFRVILAVILSLNGYVKIIIVLSILLIVQFLSVCYNIIKLYSKKMLYFQVLALREFNLLCDTVIIIYTVASNLTIPIPGVVLAWKNLFFAIIFLISVLVNIVYLWCLNKRRQRNWRKI